ncbi:hypothetical protein BTH42_32005 [Burkholderia sp. SRS-W-2-2016]|nr:hypothetical protein BTH42_32005 [Burkholderia sp. SRS-W-2-2016]
MPPAEASDLDALLRETQGKAVSDHLEWQLEAVKHLVILNGAGLAAAATVLAGNGNSEIRFAASYAASACAYGLIVALFLMIWRWFWALTQARRFALFINDFKANRVPKEDAAKLALSRFGYMFALGFAAMSLGAFILAMYFVFHTARVQLLEDEQPEAQSVIAYKFHI